MERSRYFCEELKRDNNDAISEYWMQKNKKIA
jgi:hypothetical protein